MTCNPYQRVDACPDEIAYMPGDSPAELAARYSYIKSRALDMYGVLLRAHRDFAKGPVPPEQAERTRHELRTMMSQLREY
jgi:hypothetical protein